MSKFQSDDENFTKWPAHGPILWLVRFLKNTMMSSIFDWSVPEQVSNATPDQRERDELILKPNLRSSFELKPQKLTLGPVFIRKVYFRVAPNNSPNNWAFNGLSLLSLALNCYEPEKWHGHLSWGPDWGCKGRLITWWLLTSVEIADTAVKGREQAWKQHSVVVASSWIDT